MAENLWLPDPDPHIAGPEGRLTDALTTYLYRVHQGAHLALGLPAVPGAEVQAAYRTPVLPAFAKAEGDAGWSKAAALFGTLRHTPRGARDAADLAHALAHSWYERGLIEDVSSRAVMQAQLVGRIRAGQTAVPDLRAPLNGAADRALAWAQERACLHVRHLRDSTRTLLAGAVVDALLRGDSPGRLASDLVARFGTLNRDARRLAVTELSFARSNGFLEGVPAGEQVEWFAARDACPGCQRLHGQRFIFTAGPADPGTCVWVGKHNVGLRAGDRSPTIPLHPNCRCRWVRVGRPPLGVSPRLEALLARVSQS